MPGKDERLTRWWEGLSKEERAEAHRARKSGQLTERQQKSLEDAQVIKPGQGKNGRTVTPQVDKFLKMRH